MYIADYNNNRIRKVTVNTSFPDTASEVISSNLRIRPNPANNTLYVAGVKMNGKYVVFNITGIMQQRGKLRPGSDEIDIKDLQPGIYLLEIMGEDGVKEVRKFMKE